MRKRVWNRSISLLLVAVISVTIFAGTSITAAAETGETLQDTTDEPTAMGSAGIQELTDQVTPEAEVSSISLTIPSDLLKAGAIYKASDYGESRVTLDTGNCTVKSIEWRYPGGALLQDNDQLERGSEYGVSITLDAPADGTFAANPAVSVNGENATDIVVSKDSKQLVIDWKFIPKAELAQTVTLANVPVRVNGAKAAEYNYETTECTATGTWYRYDDATQAYVKMESGEEFKNDANYRFDLLLNAKPGFYFDGASYFEGMDMDGDSVELSGGIVSYAGDSYKVSIYYSSGEAIDSVEFTVPEPVVGKNLDDPALNKVTVPAGSHYEVTGEWEDEAYSTDGVFTKGQVYYFQYTVSLHDGYYLGKTVQVFVNGAHEATVEGNGKTMRSGYNKSLRNQINEVILSDVPKAELGKTLQVDGFDIKVPAGAKYKATGQWMYYDWDSKDDVPVTDDNNTVLKGQKYTLHINLRAETGYEFAEEYILTIDGASQAEFGGGQDTAASEMEYSFLEQIRQIEVTGVVEPVVGEVPDTSKLQPADPTKYTIKQSVWTEGGIWDEPVTRFEHGGTYYLNVEVEAKPGYEIAPNASWKMGAGSGSTDPYTSESVYLEAEYSFATLIPAIRISNISTVKVGEKPSSYFDIPTDANYLVGGDWYVWDDEKESYEPVTGVFEAGKTYRMLIMVSPNSGYRFNEDATAVYLDGVLKENFTISTDLAYGYVYHVAEDTKLIHKVELTIDNPTVGNHYSIPPVVTLPAGVNYHLTGYDSTWYEGNIDEKGNFIGYFVEGGSYGADFALTANEGYVFAEDLLIVVNGIALPQEAYSASSLKTLHGMYFFNMTCEHVYDNESDNTCNVCGYQRVVDKDGTSNTDSDNKTCEHVYDNESDNTCNVCGYQRAVDKGGITNTDSDNKTCEHVYDNESDNTCNVCGYQRVVDKVTAPNTGDQSQRLIWMLLIAVSGMAAVGVGRRRRMNP